MARGKHVGILGDVAALERELQLVNAAADPQRSTRAPPTNAVTAAGRQIDTAASRRATEGNELCTGADGQQHWVQPPRAELGDRMVLTTEQKLQLYRDGKQCNAPATPILWR